MGLDIYVWKEEIIKTKDLAPNKNSLALVGLRETTIKKTDVLQDKGWAIGEFLIETFDLNNGQTATIDLDEVYKEVAEEVETLSRNDADAKNEGYEESINDLLAVLKQGKEDNANTDNMYAEYSWALDW